MTGTYVDRYEQSKAVYLALAEPDRLRLRRVAADRLVEEGFEEVGSSDVSCKCMTLIETGEYKELISENGSVCL